MLQKKVAAEEPVHDNISSNGDSEEPPSDGGHEKPPAKKAKTGSTQLTILEAQVRKEPNHLPLQ